MLGSTSRHGREVRNTWLLSIPIHKSQAFDNSFQVSGQDSRTHFRYQKDHLGLGQLSIKSTGVVLLPGWLAAPMIQNIGQGFPGLFESNNWLSTIIILIQTAKNTILVELIKTNYFSFFETLYIDIKKMFASHGKRSLMNKQKFFRAGFPSGVE